MIISECILNQGTMLSCAHAYMYCVFVFKWKETWSPSSCWHQTILWYANPSTGRTDTEGLFGFSPRL